MGREEEIMQEANTRYSVSHPFIDIAKNTFIESAKWADETMLNRVCEYLYQSNRDEMAKMGRSARLIDVTDFRKKMTL